MKLLLLLFFATTGTIAQARHSFIIRNDSTLTAEEKTGLAYMREEEKLAFDAYTLMYTKWELVQFDHISNSESRHMAAVKSLLDKYGLPDPAAESTAGSFSNKTLQELYTKLITQGKQSMEEALKAGAIIEEVDIRDLQQNIQKTNNPVIINVYKSLLRGSRNHLRAFVRALSGYGITYTPAYLPKKDYETIINGPMEPGGMNRDQ